MNLLYQIIYILLLTEISTISVNNKEPYYTFIYKYNTTLSYHRSINY